VKGHTGAIGSLLVIGFALVLGCAALRSVTPADRAAAYARDAQAAAVACKSYRFDRSVGLTPDVPAMTELCK
jgi:hypothetical protein